MKLLPLFLLASCSAMKPADRWNLLFWSGPLEPEECADDDRSYFSTGGSEDGEEGPNWPALIVAGAIGAGVIKISEISIKRIVRRK